MYATVGLFLVALLLCKLGQALMARMLYMATLNVSIAVTASYIGQAGSVEFVLMFAMGLPFIIFSFRREKVFIAIYTILPAVLWTMLFVTEFTIFSSTHLDPDLARKYIYPASILSNLFLVTYQLVYFSKLSSSYYSEVHNKTDQAVGASEAKSRFLSMMSHEIRTPLNAIIGLSYILKDSNPREDQKENIEALNYSGKILLNLLNNVLDFSKMESVKIELDPIPTDIDEATRQIKKVHEANCLKKAISFDLDIESNLPTVMVDIVRFNQVIHNLVSNAIKFTDNGGVTLKLSKKSLVGNKLVLTTEIIDTGAGMNEEQQKKVWQAFTQANRSDNRLHGGTGLGLPIVKSIITAMDSEIHLDSEPGQGSRFYFDLHLEIAEEKNDEAGQSIMTEDLSGIHVLLVEDNAINVMVAKQVLEKVGIQVSVAVNGQEAVDMMSVENTYDTILMDIQMPVKDGYTASKEIRQFNQTTPILALSASVFMEVRDKIEECGMNGFIFKPFVPEDLLQQVKNAALQPV